MNRNAHRTAHAAKRMTEAPTDAEGPAGTYGCACVSRNAGNCALLRYGPNPDPDCQRCECLCHELEDHDE